LPVLLLARGEETRVRVIKERDGGIVRRVRLVGDDGEPAGPVCRFLDHLGDREFSPNTLAAYGYDLKYLFTFLDREGLDWQDFRAPHVLALLAFLRRVPSRRPAQRLGLAVVADGQDGPGRLLSPATVDRILAAVSSFYDWAIVAERLTEAQRGPDLRPVILRRPPRPGIRGKQHRIDLELARYELHRRRRQLARMPGKPRFQLEKLQCQRECQAGRARPVGQQLGILPIQCPTVDEGFQPPLTAHGEVPSTSITPGTEGTLRHEVRQLPVSYFAAGDTDASGRPIRARQDNLQSSKSSSAATRNPA